MSFQRRLSDITIGLMEFHLIWYPGWLSNVFRQFKKELEMNQNTIWIEKIKLRRCHIYLQLTLLACVSEAGTSLRLDFLFFHNSIRKRKNMNTKSSWPLFLSFLSFVSLVAVFRHPFLTVFAFFVDRRNRRWLSVTVVDSWWPSF